MNNEINTNNGFRNNIVQVTSTNIKISEKNAESYAKNAEISMRECANCLSVIQGIMAECNDIKSNIESIVLVDLDEHLDDFNNPHNVTAAQVSAYTKTETDALLLTKQPTGNYLTEHQSLSGYYTKTEIDNKGYLTSHQDISGKANSADLATVATTGAYSDLSGTPTLATVATSGSYNDLTDNPTIPADTSDLTNGAGYTTNIGTVTSVNNISPDANGNVTLTIPAAQVQSDWNQTNTFAVDYIKNKPTLSTVTLKDWSVS